MTNKETADTFIKFVFGALVCLSVTACGGGNDSSGTSSSSSYNEAKELAWIEQGKEAIKLKLRDPSSAEFRNVLFYNPADGMPVACGEVNSNNAVGGKTGFQRFVAAGSTVAYLEEEVTGGFGEVWNKFCK